ncbi:hypothetical protein, partial [Bathymodiolus thermophilus thioautotrophic gill symbiont]
MNMFNRFIIASFCLLTLSAQTLALDFTQATKDTTYILSDTQKTIRVTLDDYALILGQNNRFFDENNNQIALGDFGSKSGVGAYITAHLKLGSLNYYDIPFHKAWDLTFHPSTIEAIKNQGGKRFTMQTFYEDIQVSPSMFVGVSINDTESPSMPQRTINLCWESCPVSATFTITSTNTFPANEKAASTTH